MVIIKLVKNIPTVVGSAPSSSRKTVEGFFDGAEVDFCTYEGSPCWCRVDQRETIENFGGSEVRS